MYQLVSAIARLQGADGDWAEVNLSALSIATIGSTYTDVYLRVKSPFWAKDRTMMFEDITKDYVQRDQTLAQFFEAQGSATISAIDGIAAITKGKVNYADAYWSGYKLQRGLYASNPALIPDASEADTLIMSKPGVDGRVFYKNCLVTVNGMIHRVDGDSQYIYVMQAGRSNYLSRRNEVGIINFHGIGQLECHSITADMLFKTNADQPFSNQIFIKAPVSAKDKTVALVMGGYLFLLDNLRFFRVADDVFCLDTQSVPLVERFFESRNLIDLSSLGLEYNGANDAQISRAQLLSDAALTKWMTLSQSFLIYIDNPGMSVERIALSTTKIAKQYLTYEQPRLPLVTGVGMVTPYWVQEDDNVFSITVGDNIRNNYVFDKTPPDEAPMPADNRLPYHRETYSQAHFLNIESEKVVIVPNT
jgi:hypothetical protein